MCFALGLCILLIPLNQKHNWVGFFYRHEVEIPQEKAALCHFWYVFGKHQQNHFYLEVFGYSHSFPCYGYFSCGYKEFIFWIKGSLSCPILFTLSCTAILQMARERCHLEAAAGGMGGGARWVWGAALLPEEGSTQMNSAVKGDEGKRKLSPRQFTWRNKFTRGMIDKLVALCTLF